MDGLLQVDESAENLREVDLPDVNLLVELLPLRPTERTMCVQTDQYAASWLVDLRFDGSGSHH
jgi:hypothetical protein